MHFILKLQKSLYPAFKARYDLDCVESAVKLQLTNHRRAPRGRGSWLSNVADRWSFRGSLPQPYDARRRLTERRRQSHGDVSPNGRETADEAVERLTYDTRTRRNL